MMHRTESGASKPKSQMGNHRDTSLIYANFFLLNVLSKFTHCIE